MSPQAKLRTGRYARRLAAWSSSGAVSSARSQRCRETWALERLCTCCRSSPTWGCSSPSACSASHLPLSFPAETRWTTRATVEDWLRCLPKPPWEISATWALTLANLPTLRSWKPRSNSNVLEEHSRRLSPSDSADLTTKMSANSRAPKSLLMSNLTEHSLIKRTPHPPLSETSLTLPPAAQPTLTRAWLTASLSSNWQLSLRRNARDKKFALSRILPTPIWILIVVTSYSRELLPLNSTRLPCLSTTRAPQSASLMLQMPYTSTIQLCQSRSCILLGNARSLTSR